MTGTPCPRESELWDAIAAGTWPGAAGADLRAHVESCAGCRDAALVSSALLADAAVLRVQEVPPSASFVWWRAQLRARREAEARVERPITIVHGLAIACAAGIALSLLGTLAAWLRGSTGWFTGAYESAKGVMDMLSTVQLAGPWYLLVWGSVAATLVLAPLAIYVLFAEE